MGVNPIAWCNGDFPELIDGFAFSRCLSEIRRAGYAGTELGHGFPTDPQVLRESLVANQLELISGWYPSRILGRSPEQEERIFVDFLTYLCAAGGRYAVVAECTSSVQRDRKRSLRFGQGPSVLSPIEWDRLAIGVERLAQLANDHGVELAYHPHMGTLVQDMSQVRELTARTSTRVRLTADTGHIRFAGDDPAAFFQEHARRIALVHLKDVRMPVVERFTRAPSSFFDAVVEGVFTVPGDGDLDFGPVFHALRREGYDGWLVVEAEQDPRKADPFVYSKKGREAVRASLGV